MGTVSSTWPWLLDLKEDEVNRFFKQVREAMEASSNYEIADRIDQAVYTWREVAERNREDADQALLRRLTDEAEEAKQKAGQYLKDWKRADEAKEKLKGQLQDERDRVESLRNLLRRRQEQCAMVEPSEVAQIIGWEGKR